jgi:hypothetical protein
VFIENRYINIYRLSLSLSTENRYMGVGVLAGTMMAISLHLRQVAAPKQEDAPDSQSTSPTSKDAPERCPSLQPLSTMSTSRCAIGVCVWEDSLVVCGELSLMMVVVMVVVVMLMIVMMMMMMMMMMIVNDVEDDC